MLESFFKCNEKVIVKHKEKTINLKDLEKERVIYGDPENDNIRLRFLEQYISSKK